MKDGQLSPITDTVDTLKSGNAGQTVTGIVTTMFATVDVINEAAKRNANFIIAHEPTFYNHLDKPEWVKNNQVVKKKQELLDKHKIAVWRFHDYCHSLRPDAVSYGVAKRANWLSYYKTGSEVLTIPSTALGDLVKHLKTSLDIKQVRVIGELDQKCAKVVLMPGAWGGTRHVAKVEAENPDVLIVGEVSEWETAEYIRDSRLLGGKTALIILGHSVSEEPGMEYFVDWLQPKLTDLKVIAHRIREILLNGYNIWHEASLPRLIYGWAHIFLLALDFNLQINDTNRLKDTRLMYGCVQVTTV
jgi:putative NIF3 family GTP cyclohydrolase 1 type 2